MSTAAKILRSISYYYRRNSNWSELPSELMELILQKLTFMDYLKCREVCNSWQNMVDGALSNEGKCPPKPQFPLLLIPTDTVPYFVDLTDHKIYYLPDELEDETSLELLIGENTWCSKKRNHVNVLNSVEGWFLIQDYYNTKCEDEELFYGLFCFYNPVNKDMIKLPNLVIATVERDSYDSSKIVMSSKPYDEDSIVVILLCLNFSLFNRLFFCKVGGKSWTQLESQHIQNIVLFDIAIQGCKLYAITRCGYYEYVVVFDLSNPNVVTSERIVMVQDPKKELMFPYWELECYAYEKTFLLTDSTCEDLFVVNCKLRHDENFDIWPQEFAVHKFDKNGPRWLKIESFGDRILFLDDKGVQFISTTNIDNGPCNSPIPSSNCVYFSLSTKLSPITTNNIGVFSLTDKEILCYHSISVHVEGSLWFTPSVY